MMENVTIGEILKIEPMMEVTVQDVVNSVSTAKAYMISANRLVQMQMTESEITQNAIGAMVLATVMPYMTNMLVHLIYN